MRFYIEHLYAIGGCENNIVVASLLCVCLCFFNNQVILYADSDLYLLPSQVGSHLIVYVQHLFMS